MSKVELSKVERPKVERARLSSGVEIEYQVAGEQNGGAQDRPFVLVHGFTGSRDDFREQLPQLADLGRTIALDQRGHGGSTNTGEAESYTLDQLTADLDELLGLLEIERCDLLGHSMGGMVALRLALARPERIASLILMDTAARSMSLGSPKLMQGSALLVRAGGMRALSKVMKLGARKLGAASPAVQATIDEVGFDAWFERLEAKLLNMDPEAFATLGRGIAEQKSLLDHLGEIQCPTTVIVGEQDASFVPAADELEQGIAGARRTTIRNAAHSPQVENQSEWLQIVRDHLTWARSA
jgi:pimeloyl-ACP methyl ester carboxylesterase